jgi:hypothetical protein
MAVGALAFATASGAGEIPVVKLTPDGPLNTFPATGAFYLQGDANKAHRARAVFVRTRAGAFGGAPSCEEVSVAVAAPIRDGTRPYAIFELPAGRHPPSALWLAPTTGAPVETFDALAQDSVYLPPVWTASADAKEYKLLVDQPAFFRAGSQHCLFIYREKEEVASLNADIARLVLEGARSYAACTKSGTGASTQSQCEAKTKDELLKELKTLWQKVDANVQEKVSAQVRNKLWDAASKLVGSGPVLAREFEAWRLVLGSPLPGWDGSLRPVHEPKTPQAVAAWLLVREGSLHHAFVPVIENGKVTGSRPAFFTRQGMEVLRVGVAADKGTIQVSGAEGAPPAGAVEALKFDPASLRFPNSTVSLRDALHFLDGRVRWGTGFLPLREASDEVQRIVAKGATLSADERKRLEELRDWVGALADLLSDERDTPSLTALRGWAGRLITGCNDASKSLLEQVGITCPAEGDTAGYFGFSHVADSVFRYVELQLRDHVLAVNTWNAPGGLQVEVSEFVLAEVPPPTRVRMTIEHPTFITQLVTPVVGHTWIPLSGRTGTLFTLGFQLSLRPNPVEQPMWTHGREDLGRLFALELGIGLKTSSFDPRSRTKGLGVLGGLPGFVGVAVRPLPYLSFSGGAAIVTNQRSVLGVERRSVGLAPYFSVSAQVNAIDALRAAYSNPITSVAKVVP